MSSSYLTVVIERRDGELVDTDHMRAALDASGYKASTWWPGHHLMVVSQLQQAKDALCSALRSVGSALGEKDPDEQGDEEEVGDDGWGGGG